MSHGDCVWCDLSAHDLDRALGFYRDVIGWEYEESRDASHVAYHIARAGGAGLFQMPRKFMDLKLPAFWMSYIQVSDVDAAIATAKDLGGKVEMGPVPFDEESRIALIRDPLGAGFTVYEGRGLGPRPCRATAGRMAWNALHVSDANEVIPFYEALFDWDISRKPWSDREWRVLARDGSHIADLRQLDEDERGHFQYWAVYMAVDDLDAAAVRAVKAGGTVVTAEEIPLGPTLLISDPDWAGLFLCQAGASG